MTRCYFNDNKNKNKSTYIPQIEAKDLWLSNYSSVDNNYDYTLHQNNGELNKNKFKAATDYSLDLIELREVCNKLGIDDFEFSIENKNYSKKIINVTFEYNIKIFNKVSKNLYIRSGYDLRTLDLESGICVIDGLVAGIRVGTYIDYNAIKDVFVTDGVFGKCFVYNKDLGTFSAKKHIKTICSVDDIRYKLYENGFVCDGVEYVRWKRSTGSARVGKCLFIEKSIKFAMLEWEHCGLDVDIDDEVDLAAFESYISLTSSSIIDTLYISPKNILIVDDYDSCFEEDVISVFEEDGRLKVKDGVDTIKNSIWDGQSLIDISAMGDKYKNKGMVLLRERFFKSCCFNSNIQMWFKDNNITNINQLNGFTLAENISDIKLITTPNSIKYLKFGKLENWLELISGNFGVVKYEKPTHFMGGDLVQTHYQLINTIQLTKREVGQLLEPTFNLINLIKKEPCVLKYWINYNDSGDLEDAIMSKSDIVYKMLSINEQFCKTKLYYDFRNDFLKSFFKNLKSGHVLVNGNYSTLCSNPIEMLKYSIGIFDGKSVFGKNTIHSTRFRDGEELIGSRSPHISFSNVLIRNNKIYDVINKYMNVTSEIVYINTINENILEQLSGADMDSDTMLLSNDKWLLRGANRNLNKFKIAINKTQGSKTKRYYNHKDICDLDIKTSKNLIGEIINLSQELNTLLSELISQGFSTDSEEVLCIYYDICKLSIMSNAEIDKAKREFNFDNSLELQELRTKYEKRDDDGRLIKPNFFSHIAKQKGYYDPKKKYYKKHNTSMDYLQSCINSFTRSKKNKAYKLEYIDFVDIVDCSDYRECDVDYDTINSIFELIEHTSLKINYLFKDRYSSKISDDAYSEYLNIKQQCIDKINNTRYNNSTMIKMLKMIEQDESKKFKRLIFYTLFGCANVDFYRIIKKSMSKIYALNSSNDGNICIFGQKFIKD